MRSCRRHTLGMPPKLPPDGYALAADPMWACVRMSTFVSDKPLRALPSSRLAVGLRSPIVGRPMSLIWNRTASLSVLAFAAAAGTPCAMACSTPADIRSYAQRLAESPTAFVGTIQSIDGTGKHVTFAVHHTVSGLQGRTGGVVAVDAYPPCSAAVAFAVGQRWLYAGADSWSPSVLLMSNAAAASARDFGRMRRFDDRLAMPPRWQSCKSNLQCASVPVGCNTTAVNLEHAIEARRLSVKVLGDPAAMNCKILSNPAMLSAPQCVESRCGAWGIDFEARP